MARAMATRCCWPPDNCPGSFSAVLGEAHQAQRLLDPPLDLGRGDAAHPKAEADVLAHLHMREKRVVLEHHAEAALLGAHRVDALVVEEDAPTCDRQEAGDAVERGRLSATGRAEKGDELAARDGQGEIAKRVDRAEIAAHALEAKLFEGTPAISRTAEA